MVQQLCHIIIISVVCILWGIPVFLAFKTSIEKDNFWYRSSVGKLSFLFFLGVIILSFINSWVGLVAPVHFSYLFFCTAGITGYLSFFKREQTIQIFKSFSKYKFPPDGLHIAFLALVILLFLLLSSLQPANGDTQIYHLQVIRWQYEYGTVPGIANLYPRLGLNSNWLNLTALFYLPLFKNENFTYLNAAFVIWFFLWLFSTWNFHFKQMSTKKSSSVLSLFYFLFILYGLFDWQLFRDAANSTNFDFIVTAFLLIVFSYFIEGILDDKSRASFSLLLLLFSFTVIGFKFSGVFILILVAYHLFTRNRLSNWVIAGSMALLLLVPVLLRNYITSGYPFFPGTIRIASPDWQFPQAMAEKFYEYIRLSNKFYNHRLSFAYDFHLTAFNWIPVWFEGVLLKHKIIFVLALLSAIFLFVKSPASVDQRRLRRFLSLLLLMIAGWFFTAPDPGRFGYGMLLTSAFLFVSLTVNIFFNLRIYNPVLMISMVALGYYFFKKSDGLNLSQYWKTPASVINPGFTTVTVNQLELHLPNKVGNNSDYRCYFTTLPCITGENPYLEPRGKSIKAGFRMRLIADSNFIKTYNY